VFWDVFKALVSGYNSLSESDYVSIITTYEIINQDNQPFNCFNCLAKAKNPAKIQLSRSCQDIKDKHVNFTQTKNYRIEYFTCIGNFYSKAAENLVGLYEDYKKGILPNTGGLYDQPAKLVDAFSLMYSMECRIREEKQRQSDAKMKRMSKTRK